MARTINNAKQIQRKSHHHRVRRVGPNWYKVFSAESQREYDVNLGVNGGTCTCLWGRYRPRPDHRSGCTHVIAAMGYRARQHGRQISLWTTQQEARRQHRPIVPIGDGLIVTTRLH